MHHSPLSHAPLTSVTCTTHLCHMHCDSPLSHAPLTSVTRTSHLCHMHHSPLSHARLPLAARHHCRRPMMMTTTMLLLMAARWELTEGELETGCADLSVCISRPDDLSVCISRPDDLSVCISRPDDLSVCISRPDGVCARSVDPHFSSVARCLPSGSSHCNASGAARTDLVKVSCVSVLIMASSLSTRWL